MAFSHSIPFIPPGCTLLPPRGRGGCILCGAQFSGATKEEAGLWLTTHRCPELDNVIADQSEHPVTGDDVKAGTQ